MKIRIEKTSAPKPRPDQKTLGFGKYFTDHMFIMDYDGEQWRDARIVPYAPLMMDPASMVFHYAQEIFEGLKAYRRGDGAVQLFRPDANVRRMNSSCERLCMPTLDVDFGVECIRALVETDSDWVPSVPGASLYIRPFMIATDPYVGVRASQTYKYVVILSPVGAYYESGLDPVNIYVETEYTRATKGGTGEAKAGGNYASSIISQEKAKKRGYAQVLWLDARENRYVEEVGTMNVFFKIGGKVITPALAGSILPGITRDSCIKMLKSWGVPVEERLLPIAEVFEAYDAGRLEEVFGTGTAAVISPVGNLEWNGRVANINGGKIGELSQKLYDGLTGIQYGEAQDTFGWTLRV